MSSTDKYAQVNELKKLAKEKSQHGSHREHVVENMVALRKMGFTNREIYTLLGGAYSEPYIKECTRSTKVTDASARERAIEVLAEAIKRDISLEEVEDSIQFDSQLEEIGITRNELAYAIKLAKDAGMDMVELDELRQELATSGKTVRQLLDALVNNSNLEKAGFTIEVQAKLVAAARKLGSPEKVFESLEIQREAAERDATRHKRDSLQREVQALSIEKQANLSEWQAVKQAREVGYGQAELAMINQISAKVGGPKVLLPKMSRFVLAMEDERYCIEKQATKKTVEADLKMMEVRYAHRKAAIDLCEALYKLGYSYESIRNIYTLAETYGPHEEVLKAVGTFGATKTLDGRYAERLAAFNELTARYADLKGRCDALFILYLKSQSQLAASMEQKIHQALQNLSSTFNKNMEAYDYMMKKYAQMQGEIKSLEPELRAARYLISCKSIPDFAKEVPYAYALQFVDCLQGMCRAKNFNPAIPATTFLNIQHVTVTELLTLIRAALERGVATNA